MQTLFENDSYSISLIDSSNAQKHLKAIFKELLNTISDFPQNSIGLALIDKKSGTIIGAARILLFMFERNKYKDKTDQLYKYIKHVIFGCSPTMYPPVSLCESMVIQFIDKLYSQPFDLLETLWIGRLSGIVVKPEHRNQGLATLLQQTRLSLLALMANILYLPYDTMPIFTISTNDARNLNGLTKDSISRGWEIVSEYTPDQLRSNRYLLYSQLDDLLLGYFDIPRKILSSSTWDDPNVLSELTDFIDQVKQIDYESHHKSLLLND